MSRSTRVVIVMAALAAVVLIVGSVAAAKTCGVVKSSSGCATGGVKMVEKHDGKTVKTLGTCEKEIAALHEKYGGEFVAIHEKHEAKIVELAEKTEALEREIGEIIKADQPDLSTLESRLKKMSDLRFELTKLRFRMHKEARAVVDEGDRAALDRHFAMGVGCCGGAGAQATYHPGRAEGKFEMKACCPGGAPGHCAGKVDMKACCPGPKGHTSMASPRMLFVGEKDGHTDVQVLDDVHGMLGCAPGTLGEKRIEVLLDEEDLEGDAHRIIKRMHAVPGHEADEFVWKGRGGSVGPF